MQRGAKPRGVSQTGRRRHVVVVGGGIAGLAAAHQLLTEDPDLQVTVLEGAPDLGGKLRLGEIAGIPVDVGAEAMLNRRPEATELARRVGLADSVVHPVTTTAGIWTRGRMLPLPPTLMGVPADLGAAARSGILSRRGVLRAAGERLLPALDVSEDVSVGRLVARRLGPEVRDRLVEPLLGGVYAGHADELSLHATVPQLVSAVGHHGRLLAAAQAVHATATASVDGSAHPPVFAGIAGGVGRLAVETARSVERLGGRVRTGAMVREMTRTDSGWRLVVGPTRSPETVSADAVVVAAPAVPAARLLRTAAPRAAGELARIDYASMAIVTLAVSASALPETVSAHSVGGSGFLVPPVDGRTIKAATFSSGKWSWLDGDTYVLRCSIGRHGEEEILQRDDPDLVDEAMADLHDAVGLRGPLLDASVTRWGGALPQYAVGHLDRVARIRDSVAAVPGVEVCGAAYDGVGIPAVIASATAAATQVLGHLDEVGTMAP